MNRIEFIRWSAFGGLLLMLSPKVFSSPSYKVMRQATSTQIRHGMMNNETSFQIINQFQCRVEKTIFFEDGVGPGQDDLFNFNIEAFSKRIWLSVLGKTVWVNGREFNNPMKDNYDLNEFVQANYQPIEIKRLSKGKHTVQPNEETIVFSLSERPFQLNNVNVDSDSFVLLSRNKKFTIQSQPENQLIFIKKRKK